MNEADLLTDHTVLLTAGNRLVPVPPEILSRLAPGDRLLAVESTGAILHVPAAQQAVAEAAVSRACEAFAELGTVPDAAISRFFEEFARRLADAAIWAGIAAANARDVEAAQARGRSTTRLLADEKMRSGMIAGLRAWRDAPTARGRVLERVEHEGWAVEQIIAPLGVVGFVFEARPNVFADATGVLRGGNTVVFRIGSDALGTARAIVEGALDPALEAAGLPQGAAVLLPSGERASGWALFSDSRLALAVARGSGSAVAQLGGVARQAGIPVSLHGTGGAWLVADEAADPVRLRAAVVHSLDRKVCNTLNVCCLPRRGRPALTAAFLDGLRDAGGVRERGFRLHVVQGDEAAVPAAWFTDRVGVRRAEGVVSEPVATMLPEAGLAQEWEWEGTPELTLKLVDSLDEAVSLCNRYSPQFVASLISDDPAAQVRFYERVNAPFVGNGFTRWVDGQYALSRPELGLSNWQHGRLFARGGILSGDGVYTIRTRAVISDRDLAR